MSLMLVLSLVTLTIEPYAKTNDDVRVGSSKLAFYPKQSSKSCRPATSHLLKSKMLRLR